MKNATKEDTRAGNAKTSRHSISRLSDAISAANTHTLPLIALKNHKWETPLDNTPNSKPSKIWGSLTILQNLWLRPKETKAVRWWVTPGPAIIHKPKNWSNSNKSEPVLSQTTSPNSYFISHKTVRMQTTSRANPQIGQKFWIPKSQCQQTSPRG